MMVSALNLAGTRQVEKEDCDDRRAAPVEAGMPVKAIQEAGEQQAEQRRDQ